MAEILTGLQHRAGETGTLQQRSRKPENVRGDIVMREEATWFTWLDNNTGLHFPVIACNLCPHFQEWASPESCSKRMIHGLMEHRNHKSFTEQIALFIYENKELHKEMFLTPPLSNNNNELYSD